MKAGTGRDLIEWVLAAKGIGIILVAIGHFYPETSPPYWTAMRTILYSFHMPLFFFLSGYLYSQGKHPFGKLIKNKTERLLYPFASICGVFFIIKYIAGKFVTLQHPINMHSLSTLLLDPVHSFMPLLWFVYALFFIFAIYPLLRLLLGNLSILLLLLSINTVFGHDYIILGNTMENMPFFVVGVMMKENKTFSNFALGAKWRTIILSFILFCFVYSQSHTINRIGLEYSIFFVLGILGTLFVANISRIIVSCPLKKAIKVLLQIGFYSMTIYLLHTLFESAIRIGFLQVLKQIPIPFEVIAFVAILCGIIIPLLLEKKVLRKYWITRKFILGLSGA